MTVVTARRPNHDEINWLWVNSLPQVMLPQGRPGWAAVSPGWALGPRRPRVAKCGSLCKKPSRFCASTIEYVRGFVIICNGAILVFWVRSLKFSVYHVVPCITAASVIPVPHWWYSSFQGSSESRPTPLATAAAVASECKTHAARDESERVGWLGLGGSNCHAGVLTYRAATASWPMMLHAVLLFILQMYWGNLANIRIFLEFGNFAEWSHSSEDISESAVNPPHWHIQSMSIITGLWLHCSTGILKGHWSCKLIKSSFQTFPNLQTPFSKN